MFATSVRGKRVVGGARGGVSVLRGMNGRGRPDASGTSSGDATFFIAGLGVASLGGYFPMGAGQYEWARVSHQPGRSHAQTPSGDVQSSASIASDSQRPERRSSELSIVLGFHRTIARARAAAAALARHAALHVMRSGRALHCWRCLTTGEGGRPVSWFRRTVAPGAVAGGDCIVGVGHSGWRPRTGTTLVRIGRARVGGARTTVSPRRGRGTVACHAFQAP
jgi:hypothetical protein